MADSFKTINKISTAVSQNQFFLYFLFVLAIIYLYNFVAKDDMISAGVLLLSGVLTSFFSKNMVIIISVSLLVTYIYCISVKYKEMENAAKEGFVNKKDEDESDDEGDDEGDDEDEDESDEEGDDTEQFKNRGPVDDISETTEYLNETNIKSMNYVRKLIIEWCLDDNGINMLYKSNGQDRYPEFKLYKMIARCVHFHTPDAQLERECFKKYL